MRGGADKRRMAQRGGEAGDGRGEESADARGCAKRGRPEGWRGAAAVKERAKRGKRAESRGRGCERLREAGESRGEERDCGRESAEIRRRG